MKRGLLIAFAVLLASGLAGCTTAGSSGASAAVAPKTVGVGFAAPLTGDNAVYGQGMKRAVDMAIAQVNSSDAAKKANVRFVVVPLDDQGDPKQAVNVANALVGDPRVAGVVGHFNSGCSVPASAVYERAHMAMVTVSTNPVLTAGGLTVVDRVVPKDDAQGEFAAALARKLGVSKVVVVDDSTQYGAGLASEFTKRFAADGGTVISSDKIQPKDTDFMALVARFKAAKPDAIYYGGAHTEGALISRQAKGAGLDVPVIGGDMLFSDEYVKIAGAKAADGDICTSLGLPIEQQPGGPAFIAAYKAKYGKGPEAYDSYAYDSANIIMKAVLQAGADRATVAKTIRGLTYDGVAGTTSFDANGDTTNKVISAYKVVNGAWAQIKD